MKLSEEEKKRLVKLMTREGLRIVNGIDLKILKKYGFKQIQQDKRINYIYMPVEGVYENPCLNDGNSIVVYADRNIYTLNYYLGQDRQMEFRFHTSVNSFNKTILVLYDLIKDGLVEKYEERIKTNE